MVKGRSSGGLPPGGDAKRGLSPVGGPRRVYRGKKVTLRDMPEGAIDRLNDHPEIAKKLTPREINFLGVYYATGSREQAYRALRPGSSRNTCNWEAGKLLKAIRVKITQDEEWELFGPSLALMGKTAKEGMEATFHREFITREGDLVKGTEQPDHAVRQKALENSMKLRGIGKEEGGGGIHVSITMFSDPRDTSRWPGGEVDITPGGEEEGNP